MAQNKNETGCKRCGRCCYYVIYTNNTPRLKKCKHLVRLSTGLTICREYNKIMQERTKHGFKIDSYMFNGERKDVFCVWRMDGQWNYKDCPFNTDNLPYFFDHLKQIGIKQ